MRTLSSQVSSVPLVSARTCAHNSFDEEVTEVTSSIRGLLTSPDLVGTKLECDIQLKKILYRMSKPHIDAVVANSWALAKNVNQDITPDAVDNMSTYCSLVGCDSDVPADLMCGKCQINNYCSKSCQRR